MVSLPVELQLEIASHIRNMWDKQKYVETIGIDNLYYGKNRSRPVPKDFVHRKQHPSSNYVFDNENEKSADVYIPIKGTEKSYYMYVFEKKHNVETRVTTCCRIVFKENNINYSKMLWEDWLNRIGNFYNHMTINYSDDS